MSFLVRITATWSFDLKVPTADSEHDFLVGCLATIQVNGLDFTFAILPVVNSANNRINLAGDFYPVAKLHVS